MREGTAINQRSYLIITAKYLLFIVGCFILSCGIVLTIEARLGLGSWALLHQGLSSTLSISFGNALQGVSALVIAIGWFLGARPTLATFLNGWIVGFFCDTISRLHLIPYQQSFALAGLYLLGGTWIMGMGTALYMSAGVGQGPRDNLMVALIRITKKRVALVRSSLEYSALFAGYLCGGPVGLGTLVHALLMGIFVESGFRLIQRLEETPLRGVVRVPVGRFTPKADRPGTPGGQSSVV